MHRPPEAYRRSTLFVALQMQKEIVAVGEPVIPNNKKESLKERVTLKGSIKRSIAGLFRTSSQQGV